MASVSRIGRALRRGRGAAKKTAAKKAVVRKPAARKTATKTTGTAAKKSAVRRPAAKKAATKRAAASKPTAKKAAARTPAAKKTTAKKTHRQEDHRRREKAATKAAARKAVARKTTARKAPARKPATRATAAKKTAAKKTTAKKTTAKKTTAKKTTAKKTTAKKAAAKKTTAKKAAAKKTTANKTTANKTAANKTTSARKAAAKKPTARKPAAKKTIAKKAATKPAARKTPARKTAARKASPTKTGPTKAGPAKTGPTKTGPTKTAATSRAAAKSPARAGSPAKAAPRSAATEQSPATGTPAATPVASPSPASVAPSEPQRPAAGEATTGEPAAGSAANSSETVPEKKVSPVPPAKSSTSSSRSTAAVAAPATPPVSEWTPAEFAEIRRELTAELDEMRAAYDRSLRDLNDLQQSSTDGAGDDQADAGSKTFEREQEQSIAANRLDLLTQIQRAVERIDAGTYGYCESCGKPIPKARLQGVPERDAGRRVQAARGAALTRNGRTVVGRPPVDAPRRDGPPESAGTLPRTPRPAASLLFARRRSGGSSPSTRSPRCWWSRTSTLTPVARHPAAAARRSDLSGRDPQLRRRVLAGHRLHRAAHRRRAWWSSSSSCVPRAACGRPAGPSRSGLVLGGAAGQSRATGCSARPASAAGHVVDWISLFGRDGHVWPIFNLADSAIVCGAVLARSWRCAASTSTAARAVDEPRAMPAPTHVTASRLLPVPDGLDGLRLDVALSRLLGFSRTSRRRPRRRRPR